MPPAPMLKPLAAARVPPRLTLPVTDPLTWIAASTVVVTLPVVIRSPPTLPVTKMPQEWALTFPELFKVPARLPPTLIPRSAPVMAPVLVRLPPRSPPDSPEPDGGVTLKPVPLVATIVPLLVTLPCTPVTVMPLVAPLTAPELLRLPSMTLA